MSEERKHSEETIKGLKFTPVVCPNPECSCIHIIVQDTVNNKMFTIDYNPNKKDTEQISA